MKYENKDLLLHIMNTEKYYKKAFELKNNKKAFKIFVKNTFNELNKEFDLINNYEYNIKNIDSEIIREYILNY